jgi:glycine cleavage system H protein
MKVLAELRYSKDHEWVKVEGNRAYIGITDYAQDELGDIVFVELPKEGAELNAGDVLGTVESVKAASDIYAPISGTVIEINDELEDAPEKINEDPYEAWIAVLEISDSSELENLLSAEDYEKFCAEEA